LKRKESGRKDIHGDGRRRRRKAGGGRRGRGEGEDRALAKRIPPMGVWESQRGREKVAIQKQGKIASRK